MEPTTNPRPSFLERRPIRRFLRRLLDNWLLRHRHPFNFWIHLVGIPLTLVGVVLWFNQSWSWGTSAFVGGYLLQFAGHWVEGNDLGEWAAIKRLLGMRYVDISPRWQTAPDPHVTA